MKAGIIGTIDGDATNIESFNRTIESKGQELDEALEIRQKHTDLSGELIGYSGRAAVQRVIETEDVEIGSDGGISVTETPQTTTLYSEFLINPTEFVVIRSNKGSFVFDLLESYTGVSIERGKINLKSYSSGKPNANPWKIGFYGKHGNAENGIVHGNGLLEDEDIGEILANTATNQLGLEFEREGIAFKLNLTESGYCEVYQPSNFDSAEYIKFIQNDLLPHIELDG